MQTLHTTTAVVVNENEPALLRDMAEVLERLVPRGNGWHDDLARRPGAPPDEPANGDAHCQAMLLSASQTLTIHEQRIQLGRLANFEIDYRSRQIVFEPSEGMAQGRAVRDRDAAVERRRLDPGPGLRGSRRVDRFRSAEVTQAGNAVRAVPGRW